MKNFNIFDQNHGLTPQEISKLVDRKKLTCLKSRKACFLSRTLPIIFSKVFFAQDQKMKNFKNLDQNHGPTPQETSNSAAK